MLRSAPTASRERLNAAAVVSSQVQWRLVWSTRAMWPRPRQVGARDWRYVTELLWWIQWPLDPHHSANKPQHSLRRTLLCRRRSLGRHRDAAPVCKWKRN